VVSIDRLIPVLGAALAGSIGPPTNLAQRIVAKPKFSLVGGLIAFVYGGSCQFDRKGVAKEMPYQQARCGSFGLCLDEPAGLFT
jgi:hypothetical protein